MTNKATIAQVEYVNARERLANAQRELRLAEDAMSEAAHHLDLEKMATAAQVPVDRSAVTLTDGLPVPADGSHRETRGDGQQKGYVVLSEAERAKGFVRPVRSTYRHVGIRPAHPTRALTDAEKIRIPDSGYVAYEEYPKAHGTAIGRFWTQAQLDSGCGKTTSMGRALAETYARDPHFYSDTMCTTCGGHFPVGERGEFVWVEPDGSDGPRVGT